jgi:hypothetical protein
VFRCSTVSCFRSPSALPTGSRPARIGDPTIDVIRPPRTPRTGFAGLRRRR